MGAESLPTDSSRPTPASNSNQVYKDLFAGTIGGITQVLAGQPFDIIKVRLQSSNQYKSMSDAAIQISRNEGFSGFYKGTSLPLIGIGACVSIQFGCLEASKRAFKERNLANGNGPQLSLGQLYLSGAAAGVGNSIISGPVEHIRIRLQTSSSPAQLNHFLGPGDALKKIIRSDGILRGLYCGQLITVAREFHGYGMYFLGYEWLVERHMKLKDCSRSEIGTGWAMLYGAGAGYSMWLSSYPLDQIKTRIQTDGLPSQSGSRKYFGILDCVRKIYVNEGYRGFLRGLTPTLIRSPLVNGATFAAFETTMRFLNSS
ncbi:Mitochondrial carrier protein ymc2 [Puccinia graminis f. sp. tritici]|uniref:MC family mitochondrial carrier protein n=2 Tax=Puccinia graminis f. sp. tritici TaxID=56615 RepID=H6QUA7_PUCGT|nr:MC family mitochondrial carrier protein [Puccinia graminis f. sp. tritici CRL 75-36-700-3]EHS64570.1 MC family mitochondrial carrier protein [Puccinia graminis f. sp. tritici CRL 75-36-700-3]KAA1089676.1 Mitochondrial carrier protein ymc2 [Puccinia graminis f. sp. tritici]